MFFYIIETYSFFMIPETLLIQTVPIRWIGSFSMTEIVYSLGIVIFIFVSFFVFQKFQKKNRNRKIQQEILGILPILGQTNFEQQAAMLLRKYIQHIYLPYQSEAHTAKDMEKYVDDHRIISMLVMLEQAEYQNRELSQEEQNQVLDDLKKLQ